MHNKILLLLPLLTAVFVGVAFGEAQDQRPRFQSDGSVVVPSFVLPPSEYLSDEAVNLMKQRAEKSGGYQSLGDQTIEAIREKTEKALAPRVRAMRDRYSVAIEDSVVGGVPVKVITPKDTPVQTSRVLINLHGGAFHSCWPSCALLESIPLAAVGGFKTIAVDYRMGPEHIFPAASEDVEKVYRSVLANYKPENIGIFGCSAGGSLTAQSIAWFQKQGLPRPGAAGVFGATAGRLGRGDSIYTSAYISGEFPPPEKGRELASKPGIRSYFDGIDMTDPLVSPVVSDAVLSLFPPTFVVTGTRSMDLSGAVYSHYRMKKLGVDAELLVGEGMGHCYLYEADLPEAIDAVDLIVRFFNKRLGSG